MKTGTFSKLLATGVLDFHINIDEKEHVNPLVPSVFTYVILLIESLNHYSLSNVAFMRTIALSDSFEMTLTLSL